MRGPTGSHWSDRRSVVHWIRNGGKPPVQRKTKSPSVAGTVELIRKSGVSER
jgi:hypothetical protein